MSDKFLLVDEVNVPGDTEDHAFVASEEEAAEYAASRLPKDQIVRIEAQVAVVYDGVTLCCRQDRVDHEVRVAFEAWVKSMMYKYRHWRWVRYGHAGGTIQCRQYQDSWSGKRSCTGRGGISGYIEFRKP